MQVYDITAGSYRWTSHARGSAVSGALRWFRDNGETIGELQGGVTAEAWETGQCTVVLEGCSVWSDHPQAAAASAFSPFS